MLSQKKALAHVFATISIGLASFAAWGISPVHAASVSAPGCAATVGDSSTVTLARVDDNCVLKFTSGSNSWTVPTGMTSVRVLIAGGGGGGGQNGGGGGGGGQVVPNATFSVTAGATLNLSVAAGGAAPSGSNGAGGLGGTTTFSTLSALGGGGGGTRGSTPSANAGQAGYTGGGGGGYGSVGGTGSSGANGGTGFESGCDSTGGGGGGAGGTSGTIGASRVGGNGGNGVASTITGSTTYFGGGGAGGGTCDNSQTQTWTGVPGLGGAGSASRAATANTGGGGGGGGAVGWSCYGGAGGSGVVILAWPGDPIPPFTLTNPSITGTAKRTYTLTGSAGTWSQSPSSFSYQWLRASTAGGTYSNIASATTTTYTLTSSDINMFIKFAVSATNANGTTTEISAATSQVVDLPASTTATLSSSTSTSDGFTFSITNIGSLGSYTVSVSTSAGTVARANGVVTVSGLTGGASATVTVTTSRSGYNDATASISDNALPAPTTTTTTPTSTTTTTSTTSTTTTTPASSTTTVPVGQAAVATIAPTATTVNWSNTTTTTIATTSRNSALSTSTTTSTTTSTVPAAPSVEPGQASLVVDGEEVDATVSRSNDQLVISAGVIKATVSGTTSDGSIAPLDASGNIHLNEGDSIAINADGFSVDTNVEVWMFSTPTRLGIAKVSANGNVSASFPIPSGMSKGHHRLVLKGLSGEGKESVFAVGIIYGKTKGITTTGKVLIVTPLLLAIGAALILPARRRKKGVLV